MVTQVAMTVKKNDGVTDVIYTNTQASGGDSAPAIWQLTAASGYMAFRPELRMKASAAGDGLKRRPEASYTYPVTAVGSDGKTYVANRANFTLSGSIPNDMSDADVNEAVAQFFNCLVHANVKQSFQSRFAPT